MRLVTIARAGLGGLLLAVPDTVSLRTRPVDDRMRIFMRILGARHLLQAWFVGAHPRPGRLRLGCAVDAIHCATMIGLARADRRRRESALINAGLAALFAGADWRTSRRVDPGLR